MRWKVDPRNELLHRDIAPDNIYIKDDGTPVLLDFGSAKEAVGQRTKTISAVVKDVIRRLSSTLRKEVGRGHGRTSTHYQPRCIMPSVVFALKKRPSGCSRTIMFQQSTPQR